MQKEGKLRVTLKLSNDRYLLYHFEMSGKSLVLLIDKLEKTESLGVCSLNEEEIKEMWERQKNSSYCLPCELLLHLDPKVVKAENCVAELGISLKTLERVKSQLEVEND